MITMTRKKSTEDHITAEIRQVLMAFEWSSNLNYHLASRQIAYMFVKSMKWMVEMKFSGTVKFYDFSEKNSDYFKVYKALPQSN